MRVHPSILAPKSASKWQFPLAFALLIFLLVINLTRGPQKPVEAAQRPIERRIEVVVAQASVEAGQPLEKASLVLEQRPVNTLPADAITNFEVLRNKVAAGPIPAGYPLAMALLADPVPVIAVDGKSLEDELPEDPTEMFLQEIERETVAVPVLFKSASPERGARIAITLSLGRSDSLIVIDECWVSKSSGRNATLRLDPQQALIMQDARGHGSFDFIELPPDGASPYEEKAKVGQAELTRIINSQNEGAEKARQLSKTDDKPKESFTGYAWVAGEGIRFGLDSGGRLHVVDQSGKSIGAVRDGPK